MSTPDDQAFVDAMLRDLDARHAARRDGLIAAAARPEAHRTPRARWLGLGLAALVAAALGSGATWLVMRPDATGGDERALGFGSEPLQGGADEVFARDAEGRVTELARRRDGVLDGERVVFRGGAVARIERWAAGALDGVVLDFDARGRVARLTTYAAGVAHGPWLEYDADGRVRAAGVTP